ncbi:MAG TPA: amidohydrolase family protein [Candidatus Sulfotelmatobacter sp.]|nr:amidohydrolase family protein [Candidatus Sulfotelmatobacter sp.]
MRPNQFHWILRSVLLFSVLAGFARVASGQSVDLAITHVTIINPGAGKPQPDRTILIRGHDIAALGPAKHVTIPPSAQVIDATGKFVIPGLWDMHSHFRDASRDLKMDIANGVLGTRNMGGVAKEVFPLRDAIARGQQLGPKIVACGPILDGPDSWSNPQFTISVTTVDEARAAVVSLKQQGTDCIKVYDGLSRDSYFAILDEAKKLGLPVVGHLPRGISLAEASNAGQRSLEHGIALAGGSTAENEYIKRGLDLSAFQEALRTKNFALIPAKIARDNTMMLDTFSQERADATYRLLAKNNTFITPTLVTERSLTFIDDLNARPDPRMQYVSAEELQWWKPENGMLTKYRTPEYIAMRKREYAKMLEEVHRAQTLGVRLLAGTDITIPYTYPGFSLHDELKLFVEAGLTPMQALETATTNPALFLGLSKTWGRVGPGYSANFVLLTADPLADISNTLKIESVVVNGEYLDRTRLDQLLHDSRAPNR